MLKLFVRSFIRYLPLLFSLLFLSTAPVYAEDEAKIESSQIQRIQVTIKGVKNPLLKNIYNHLAIYRLRNNPRLQELSVSQLYRQAHDDIKAALAPYGYYNPTISATIEELPSQNIKTRWHTIFTIEKGPPVRIENIHIEVLGEGENSSEIRSTITNFSLKKGGILNQEIYEKEKKKLLNTAIAAGYLDAAFNKAKIQIDPNTNQGWIELLLTTGKAYYFGETEADANSLKAFSNTMLQGYLPYTKGDSYDVAKLFELQSILYRTGYFSAVTAQGKTEEEKNGFIPIEVELTPFQANNTFTIGGGYATDTGIRTHFNWKSRMFNDNGDRIGASIEVAEKERNLYLSYEKPRWQDPRYDKYAFSSSWQDKSWEDTDTRLFTVAAGRNYSGPLFNLAGGVELRNEIYKIGKESDSALLLIPFGTAGLVKADDAINPQNGIRLSIGAKGAVEGVTSDTSFFQWTLGGKIVFTPFLDSDKLPLWQIIGRASFGMTMVDSIDSIPPSLRFYTGGDNSIRGYSYKSIAPKDDAGDLVGGRYLSIQSLEIERFFGKYFGIAAFCDVGTATDDLSLNYKQGIGTGLRIRLPFGEVKLDAASAISEDGYPIRIHFSVGGNL